MSHFLLMTHPQVMLLHVLSRSIVLAIELHLNLTLKTMLMQTSTLLIFDRLVMEFNSL